MAKCAPFSSVAKNSERLITLNCLEFVWFGLCISRLNGNQWMNEHWVITTAWQALTKCLLNSRNEKIIIKSLPADGVFDSFQQEMDLNWNEFYSTFIISLALFGTQRFARFSIESHPKIQSSKTPRKRKHKIITINNHTFKLISNTR